MCVQYTVISNPCISSFLSWIKTKTEKQRSPDGVTADKYGCHGAKHRQGNLFPEALLFDALDVPVSQCSGTGRRFCTPAGLACHDAGFNQKNCSHFSSFL